MRLLKILMRHWFISFLLLTFALCSCFGGATVGGWYGGAMRSTFTTCVAFVRGL